MMKSILVTFVVLLILFFSFPLFTLLNYSQSQAASNTSVAYDMPYPGVLPDNPLYFVKIARDRTLEFFTRDYIKKAKLYLLYSDKRFVMAEMLAKKGKTKLAVSTLSKGEKYFLKIPQLLKDSKQQGVTPPDDLVLRLKLANAKHKEIIDMLQRDLPDGQADMIDEVARLNTQIKTELQ